MPKFLEINCIFYLVLDKTKRFYLELFCLVLIKIKLAILNYRLLSKIINLLS